MVNILLIEDNVELLENTAEILSLANYNVIKAENGKVGLEKIKQFGTGISIILCDIMMPELDGYGVLRACENLPEMKGIPFIFLSAKSEKMDVRKGMDLGADDYLIKPFTGDELLSVISSRIKKALYLKEAVNAYEKDIENIVSDPLAFTATRLFSDKFHTKKLLKRDTVFVEGDTCFYLYYVVKGKLKTFKTNEFGKEYIVNIHKEGDFLGTNAVLENGFHSATCLALEDAEIAMISRHDFLALLSTNTEMCLRFIRSISNNLNETEDKLPKLAYHSARKKVAEALIFVALKYNSEAGDNFSFSVTRDDLSAISGISPESVSRNLTDFRNENLIGVSSGEMVILNFKKLSEMKN